jgi:transcriptional regulator with XRE-family HTH domain
MSPLNHLVAFGQRIRTLRRERGWTQTQLAQELVKQGVSADVPYLSKIENARIDYVPGEELIRGLAAVLLANADELLDLAGRIDARALQDTISQQPAAGVLLRRIQNGDVTPEQLRRWVRETEQSKEPKDKNARTPRP